MRTPWSPRAAPGAAVLLCSAVLACSPSLDPLPPSAQITCTGNADCPDGWFCQPDLDQCVKSDAAGQPPAVLVGSVVLTPDPHVASTGQLVSVSFETSADLAAPPLVELGTPVRRAFSRTSEDGRRYAYDLVVSSDVPEGTYPILARLIGKNGATAADLALESLAVDTTPPAISRIDTLTPSVSAGQAVRLEVTFGEALAAPTAHLSSGAFQAPLDAVATAQPQVWRLEYMATGTEPEGPATVALEARDAAGNVASRNVVHALVFDFTRPTLAAPPAVDTPVVRPGQQAVVRLESSEPLSNDPTVRLVGQASGTVLPLAAAERVGQKWTYGRLVLAGDPTGSYEVRVGGLADVAGNTGAEVRSGTIRIDATPPAVVAGPTLSKPSGQYRAGEVVALTLTASEDLAGVPQARLTTTTPLPLDCQPGAAARAWSCALRSALTGAETPETAVNAVIELTDQAGNVGSTSATVVLDFTAPAVVAGSTALALTPPAGVLVPAVTALAAGATARVTFTVSEPLAAEPTVATTTPGTLPFTLSGQAATTYTFQHVLSGSPAQGNYALRATLTDRAGNVSQATLDGPGFPLSVDTVPPASPDVQTAARTLYARIPWGSTATAGRASFTVTGAAGAAEASATVVAFDAADPSATNTNEIGRGSAAANGGYALTLSGGDRRQVYVLSVDRAGNASDADGAVAGAQAVRVRDVTWTATLLGKVPGSTIENPHALVARSRWLGPVEQDGSVEKALPAETSGAPSWNQVTAGGTWPSGGFRVAAQDPVRGRLVAFDATAGVLEFDGVAWTRIAYSAGPKRIDSIVFDPHRGEMVVYSDPCSGGTVLWSWNGERWRPLAVGASYTQWLAGGIPGPGPHPWGQLAFDERRGEVLLTPGWYNGDPYVCGDVAGRVDQLSYRFDGTAWATLPGAAENGGPLGFHPVRGVAVRVGVTSGVQEWNGTAWSTVTITDPEGDGNPNLAWNQARFVWDPAGQRLLTITSAGSVWTYTGSSWAQIGSGTGETGQVLATDHVGQRVVAVTASGLSGWSGSSFTGVLRPPAALTPVGMAFGSAARRMDLFEDTGAVRRWSAGSWTTVVPTDPGLDGNPADLYAATADPSGGVFACGTTCWRWNGTYWTPHPAPRQGSNLVGFPGRGIHAIDSAKRVYALSGSTWTLVSDAINPYGTGDPVYSPSLGGILAAHKASSPYSPDSVVSRWTGGATWERSYVSSAGSGAIQPVAADPAGRTFALHDAFTTYLLAGPGAPQVAAIERTYPSDHPTGASASSLDPDDQAVVLVDFSGNTFHLETEGTSRPGQLFRFAYPTSGGPDLRDCLGAAGTCQVSRVELFWRGVSTGNRTTLPSNATLSVLDGPRWRPVLGVSSAGIAGQASGTATITDLNLIGRMAAGPGAELLASVVVGSSTLSASSLLRTDEVSLRVTYRLP